MPNDRSGAGRDLGGREPLEVIGARTRAWWLDLVAGEPGL